MKETHTLIIGASISGLACAASLKQKGIDYLVIEKYSQIAPTWHNHYDRLHLHTSKRLSNLPYKKFDKSIPTYPSREQVVDYLIDYRRVFEINPIFNTEAVLVRRQDDLWVTETTNGVFKSKYVVVATGPFGKPKPISFKGMESFPGKITHSYGYKTGKDFAGQNVLVVGFGNSACEIAIDLVEQGAVPSMAVRSPVNVVPRDIVGIPVQQISVLMNFIPAAFADKLNAPLIRLLVGDIGKLGLKQLPYGPIEQIGKYGHAPLLDIGTIDHIRKGRIKIYGDVDRIEGQNVFFTDGRKASFDVIVAAIGYYRDYADIIAVDKERFDDLNVCADKQKFFGKDGLYFCGFWISPSGQIREIARDARKIAGDIAGGKNLQRV